jgi:hypothetical protein
MKERHQIQDVRMSLHRRHSQVRQRRRTTMAQFNTGDKTMNLRLCHSRFSVTSFLTSSCRRQRGENDCGGEKGIQLYSKGRFTRRQHEGVVTVPPHPITTLISNNIQNIYLHLSTSLGDWMTHPKWESGNSISHFSVERVDFAISMFHIYAFKNQDILYYTSEWWSIFPCSPRV